MLTLNHNSQTPACRRIPAATDARRRIGAHDDAVARVFSEIVADSRRRSRRPRILDALIAATAVSRGLPVYTQDVDFEDKPAS